MSNLSTAFDRVLIRLALGAVAVSSTIAAVFVVLFFMAYPDVLAVVIGAIVTVAIAMFGIGWFIMDVLPAIKRLL